MDRAGPTTNVRPRQWRAAPRGGPLALAGLLGAVLSLTAATALGQPPPPAPTPSQPEGPFYPVDWSGDVDGDLTRVAGGPEYRMGRLLLLTGRVLGADGRPVPGAQVEIWQTDAQARYRHPGDAGEAPREAGFQGFGRVTTDSQGRYAFRTVKPVEYGSRPPHVHFRVVAAGFARLTTQMYFAGESAERGWGAAGSPFDSERRSLTVAVEPGRDGAREALRARFDLVLRPG